jgi:hypothetical protein
MHSATSSTARTVGKVVLGAVILAELIAIVILFADTREPDASSRNEARLSTGSGDAASYSNAAAGYSFDYPKDWELEPNGTVAKITSPDGDAVISVGPGAGKDPLTATERMTAKLTKTYESVEITDRKVVSTALGGNLGVVLTGTATNARGADLDFEAASIQARGSGIGITAFSSAGKARVTEVFQDLLDSLEVQAA